MRNWRETWADFETWFAVVISVVALWVIVMIVAAWAGKHVVLPLVQNMP